MPGKKKGKKGSGGKKGKGKKSGKKSGTGSGKTDTIAPLPEITKQFYLIQLGDLEQRVGRYQSKCDDLQISNNETLTKYSQLSDDRKDTVSYLKLQLEKRQDEIADLNDRLVGLQQAKEAERNQYEAQLTALRTEFQETRDQLTSENMILGGKLASLEEFRVQREELMANFAALQEQLREQEDNHKHTIYDLEKKQVLDKDRLKREMIQRVNFVAAEFRKVSNKQMADTTKRTIRENVAINSQLIKMSDKTLEMASNNDKLKDNEKRLLQTMELMEHGEKEFAKRNNSNLKIIRMLTDKAKQQQEIIDHLVAGEDIYRAGQNDIELMKVKVDEAEKQLDETEKEVQRLREKLRDSEKSKKSEEKRNNQLVHTLAEASRAVKQVLLDTEMKEQGVDVDDVTVQGSRNVLYEHLAAILTSGANLGLGPEIREFEKPTETSIRGEVLTSPSRTTLKRIKAIPGDDGPQPHYQHGDLGLVPRQGTHIPTFVEKTTYYMDPVTPQGKDNRLVGVLMRSIGTQTRGGSLRSYEKYVAADSRLSAIPHPASRGRAYQDLILEGTIPPMADSTVSGI